MNATVTPLRRTVLAQQPTDGQVDGVANWSDVVRYDDGTTTRYATVVRTGLAGEQRYRLRDINTGEEFTSSLTGEYWRFHGKPNAVEATTRDHTGEILVSVFSALPKFCTPEMVNHRARKRHFVKVGVPGDLVEYHWVHNPAWAHR